MQTRLTWGSSFLLLVAMLLTPLSPVMAHDTIGQASPEVVAEPVGPEATETVAPVVPDATIEAAGPRDQTTNPQEPTATPIPVLLINGVTDPAISMPYDGMITMSWSAIPFIAYWPIGGCPGNPSGFDVGPSGNYTQSAAEWVNWAGGQVISLQGRAADADGGGPVTTCRTITIAEAPTATATESLPTATATATDVIPPSTTTATATPEPILTLNGSSDATVTVALEEDVVIAWANIPLLRAYYGAACTPQSLNSGFDDGTRTMAESASYWQDMIGPVISWQGWDGSGTVPLTNCRTLVLVAAPTATSTPRSTAVPPTDGSFTINGTTNTEIHITRTDALTLEWDDPVLEIFVYAGSGCTGKKVDIFISEDSPASYPGYVWAILRGPVLSFVGTARFGLAGDLTTCRTVFIEDAPTATATATATGTPTGVATGTPGDAPTRTPSAPSPASATATVTPVQPATGVSPSPSATSAISTLPNTGTGDGPSADWRLLLMLMGALLGMAGLLARRARRR